MRALSLWQPHGSLLVTGAKPFETRGRMTHVRGEVLLHVASRCVFDEMAFFLSKPDYRSGLAPLLGLKIDYSNPPEGVEYCIPGGCRDKKFKTPQERVIFEKWLAVIPFRDFVGIGEIINCFKTEDMSPQQLVRSRGFGDFSPGRFAWEFANVRRFTRPIPGKGHQGFWFAHLTPAELENNPLIQVS